ncbi:c-type cytochrome [Nitrosovibrio sp. Nv6]|uniref:c-type cytochrome n=1 Tax=Nitrosovibrio sp. Nv6 TaxID=1855340 RepID=UPI0008C899A8|nr:c-type cytochrome [Nitrosovibrio sp. Nv6]SEP34810.1 Cytochrome c5 [Nitrosovibrio sp. Nv6]
MSGSEDDGHSSAIKTPKQLVTVIVAAFVFPVMILWLLGKFITGDAPIDPNSRAFSDEAVAQRLEPVGKLVLAGDSSHGDVQLEAGSGPVADAASASVAASAAASVADAGDPIEKAKAIYTASCAACHTTGAAGAPKLGDNSAWAPRIKAGNETLYTSALKGKNAMPPKGGNASLSDAEVKAVVDYMVSQSK